MTTLTLTPDQVVAYNLRRARALHNLTQDEAAERLEPFLGERWSRVVFSAAERSVTSGRIRQFTASQIVAFAAGFNVPVSFFLLPPPGVDLIAAKDATQGLEPERLIELAISDQQDRLTELIEDRISDTYRLAYPHATEGIPGSEARRLEQRATRATDRQERAAAVRAAQKEGSK